MPTRGLISSVRREGVEPPESMTMSLQPIPLPLRYNDACWFRFYMLCTVSLTFIHSELLQV